MFICLTLFIYLFCNVQFCRQRSCTILLSCIKRNNKNLLQRVMLFTTVNCTTLGSSRLLTSIFNNLFISASILLFCMKNDKKNTNPLQLMLFTVHCKTATCSILLQY